MNLHFCAQNKLVYTDQNGIEHTDVTPIRAYPISAPNEGISLINTEGHEVFWLAQWSDLPSPLQAILGRALQGRDFMPVIQQLISVSTFSTPSTWSVLTDHGPTELVLKAEEDIRRIPNGGLLIQDGSGVTYRVNSLQELDRTSRRLLDRFL
jgi:hypothetical protein